MPIYEYKCTVCEQHIDVEQSFTDDALTTLPGCEVHKSSKHQLKKVFSAVGISFKGDGFYRNDARSGSAKPSASTSSDSSTESNGSKSTEKSGDSGSSTGSSGSKASSGSASSGSGSSKSGSSGSGSGSNGSTSASKSTSGSGSS